MRTRLRLDQHDEHGALFNQFLYDPDIMRRS